METDLNATAPVAPSPETGHLWVAASEPKVLTQAAPLLWEPSPQSVFSSLVLSVVGVLVCSWEVAAGDCKMEPFIDLYTASATSTNSLKRNGLESGVTDYQNCSLPCHKHRKADCIWEEAAVQHQEDIQWASRLDLSREAEENSASIPPWAPLKTHTSCQGWYLALIHLVCLQEATKCLT